MPETTATRLLRLLPLLTSRHTWPAAELASKLGVTTRTIRRDVERLRDLGYRVHATPGAHGGYTLGPSGAGLPPLLLDDEAAVAVALALANAATDPAVAGEAAARAAAALDQVLPPRLRHRIEALTAATVPLPATPFSHNDIAFIASACYSSERLRFAYLARSGTLTRRHVEPYRLVATGRRWYLVAYDLDKGAWRTFRLDRIESPAGTGVRSVPADPPDAAKFVSEGISVSPYRWRARILLSASAPVVAEKVPATVAVVEALDEQSCVLTTGNNSLDLIALHVANLGIPFTVLDPPELRARCRALAARLSAAARAAPPPPGPPPSPPAPRPPARPPSRRCVAPEPP